ncbi:MAG: DUF1330 domain-containing protein [Hyphomicrobiales bacterium]
MRTRFKFGLALILGVAIGHIGSEVIYAANSGPGYFVAELNITDPAKFKGFVQKLPETLTPFGGHFVVKPGKILALEGDTPKSVGVIAFDSVDQAKAWYDSPAYQAILPLRLSSAKTTAFIMEGVSP